MKLIHLFEAKEDTIFNIQGEKVLATIKQRERQSVQNLIAMSQEPNVIYFIGKRLGPMKQYIQWVVNCYLKDPNFKLQEDLPTYIATLTQYEQLKRQRGNNINRNILAYPDIHTLTADIDKNKDTHGASTNLILKIRNAMEEQVKDGSAEWYYKSNDILVYRPLDWHASKAIREAVGENNISLCVTYTNDSSYFYDYIRAGDLFFVLTNDMMYSFFFSHDVVNMNPYDYETEDYEMAYDADSIDPEDCMPHEFTDIKNNHQAGDRFILKNKSRLLDIFHEYTDELQEYIDDLYIEHRTKQMTS